MCKVLSGSNRGSVCLEGVSKEKEWTYWRDSQNQIHRPSWPMVDFTRYSKVERKPVDGHVLRRNKI